MKNWELKEQLGRRAIEDQGYHVESANIIFRMNCRNIDLVVFGKTGAKYVQVKSSETPAGRNCVTADGAPWTNGQLYEGKPIFNKHPDSFQAHFILLIDKLKTGHTHYYLAPPKPLEEKLRKHAKALHAKPKRDGGERTLGFRHELERTEISRWLGAWSLLGEPLHPPRAQAA